MAARTEESKAESETVIRFDETTELAFLWTASARVRREWEDAGFPVQGHVSGWTARVPTRMVTYRYMTKQARKA